MKAEEAEVYNLDEPGKNNGSSNNLHTCFAEIREMIIRGHLAPGTRIVEVELAEELGFSRTPVRGALHMLQREGYLVSDAIRSRKPRLIVAPVTKEDGIELFWIVARIEGLAARSAAQLETGAQSIVLEKLRTLNEGLRTLAEEGEAHPNRIFELDTHLHQTIVDASGQRLRSLHESVKPQIERYLRVYASAVVDQLRNSVGEHLRMIEAIESGDPDLAERAVQLNWESGSNRLARVIDTLGERGIWRKKG